MTDEEIEHYLAHRNGGDVMAAIAYRQLKVLERIADSLDDALLADAAAEPHEDPSDVEMPPA